MKRIFAIVISLLFVVSVFGVAQNMAEDPCKCQIIAPPSVKVGDVFEVKIIHNFCGGYGYGISDDLVELVDARSVGGTQIVTYKALKAGTRKKLVTCGDEIYGVTILPKSFPMQQFMKILGFGKKK